MFSFLHPVRFALITLALLLCGIMPALALATSEGQDMEARRLESQRASDLAAAETLKLLDMQSALQARPRESWSAAELYAYQQQAILCIDLGLRAQIISDMDMPYMIGPEDGGWVCQWPANPYDIDAQGKWRPIKVLDTNDPFEPGALLWQTGPAESYSLVDDWLRQRSFEVSLYGASAETEVDAAVSPQPGNDWARVPPGTAVMRGLHTPPCLEVPAETKYPREEILASPEPNAWSRAAARDWYQRHFEGREHGPNFRLSYFVSTLANTLEYERKLDRLRGELEPLASEQWTREQIDAYMQAACYFVYSALINVSSSGLAGELDDHQDLLELHLLPSWPANPFNAWQPMRWLNAGDGFSPGDILLQSAPLELNPQAEVLFTHNFILSVYGPFADYVPAQDLNPVADYLYWADVPPGSAACFSAGSSELLLLAFRRAMRAPRADRAQDQWPDGRLRRIPRSGASSGIEHFSQQLAQCAEARRAAMLGRYQRTVLQGLYESIELYKYEHGALPAELTALGGSDYLDAWPGDALAALAGAAGSSIYLPATWPAIRVLGPGEAPQPGSLVWEPGVAGDAKWVRQSLSGPFASPALAYRLSLYGSDVSAGPLYMVQGAAETYPQSRCRRGGSELLDYEVGQTRFNNNRSFWPAGFDPEELKTLAAQPVPAPLPLPLPAAAQ